MNEIKEPRSVRRNLSKLVVPIFIETLLIMMLGAVDTIMLSQYSDNAVAAVGVVNQLIMFAFLIFEVINLYLCTLFAIFGGKETEECGSGGRRGYSAQSCARISGKCYFALWCVVVIDTDGTAS